MGIKNRLQDRLTTFKEDYENTRKGDSETKINTIRSGRLIKIIEDWCVEELILERVDPKHISSNFTAQGYFKTKQQDVSVLCKKFNCEKHRKMPLLTINVRSQLSSIQKNHDTLYERAIAEVLNLHVADTSHVAGFMWLMPLYGYDPKILKKGRISISEQYKRTKYIESFELINQRSSILNKEWKFERMCMLLIDFNKKRPEPIIGLPEKPLDKKLFSDLDVSRIWKCLDYRDFFSELVKVSKERNADCMPIS